LSEIVVPAHPASSRLVLSRWLYTWLYMRAERRRNSGPGLPTYNRLAVACLLVTLCDDSAMSGGWPAAQSVGVALLALSLTACPGGAVPVASAPSLAPTTDPDKALLDLLRARKAAYEVTYEYHVPAGRVILVEYVKPPYYRRDWLASRWITRPEGTFRCGSSGAELVCFLLAAPGATPQPGALGPPVLPTDLTGWDLTFTGTKTVAGESTRCYDLTNTKGGGSQTIACYTSEGIPLYVDVASAPTMTATSFSTNVNDADFALPYAVQQFPGLPVPTSALTAPQSSPPPPRGVTAPPSPLAVVSGCTPSSGPWNATTFQCVFAGLPPGATIAFTDRNSTYPTSPFDPSKLSWPWTTARVDPDGSFTLVPGGTLPVGTHTITATAGGIARSVQVTVTTPAVTGCTLKWPETKTFLCVFAGLPPRAAVTSFTARPGSPPPSGAVTVEAGNFVGTLVGNDGTATTSWTGGPGVWTLITTAGGVTSAAQVTVK